MIAKGLGWGEDLIIKGHEVSSGGQGKSILFE